ncbi:hypothetical protein SCLCIDRAFT_1208673 [Scleroderma citrinum Foug A]|uniref:Uncharacterized protein n=1 Tax=Scleroderma citrinum Foug A TaxID=1036808 RepID=A0A0C3EM22_9AGAM|nr:hypothetical protein SCLCIDRAFT_1208673 [Scleroderma citrinum Foug A]
MEKALAESAPAEKEPFDKTLVAFCLFLHRVRPSCDCNFYNTTLVIHTRQQE